MSQLSPQHPSRRQRPRRSRGAPLLALLSGFLLAGCSVLEPVTPAERHRSSGDRDIYRRAENGRRELIEAEVKRLRTDLRQAERALVAAEEALVATRHALVTSEQALASSQQALVTTESGLRGQYTRADAVSAVAEARIRVGRAARSTPWRREAVREAKLKLEDASGQIRAGHFGSAIFFAGRARRISEALIEESEAFDSSEKTRYVRGEGVRLRIGPSREDTVVELLKRNTPVYRERSRGDWVLIRTASGLVGWVHTSLLVER